MNRSLGFRLSLLAASFAVACSAGPGEGVTDGSTSAIYGGFPASSPRFDAIGDIAEVLNTGPDGTVTMDAKCTGVLIGPHTVLTASHCLIKYDTRNSFKYTQHFFRVGADAAKPAKQVRIVGFAAGPQITGGVEGLGSDIAVLQLADDILDVTPLPIGAPLTDAEVGKPFVVIGYGRQSVAEASGKFDVRAFGTTSLVGLRGNPLHLQWNTEQDFAADVHKFNSSVTDETLRALWNSPDKAILEGQQAFFSGIHDHGVETCNGDSGGPVLRRKGSTFEVVGIVSSGFNFGVPGCFGGAYFGLPNTPDNLAFLQAQLANPTRDVSDSGYCNGAIAIRSAASGESPDPIHVLDCQSLGLVCGLHDGAATCVDPATTGPTSTCSIVGGKFVHPRGYAFEFEADGSYTLRGSPLGTYTVVDGLLTLNDASRFCAGTPGTYAMQFAADCNTLTLQIAADPCEIRAEANDAYPLVRQP